MSPSKNRMFQLLICSANMGNAEPDDDSIHAWLPEDGSMEGIGQEEWNPDSSRCVRFQEEQEQDEEVRCFDMIVIGMQEATFDVDNGERRKSEATNNGNNNNEPSKRGGFSSPEKILTDNPVVKGAEKVGKEVLSTVQQLAGSKDHTKKKTKKNFLQIQTPSDWVGGTKVLHEKIAKRLPSYAWHVAYQRGQMRMIVLARRDSPHTVEVESIKAENTGLASVAANKGGIVASLLINGGTRLGFLSAHLEAHEGTTHYQGRCSNLAEILRGTSSTTSGGFSYDASLVNHYCFVSGDLNFRTIPTLLKNKLPQEEEEGDTNSIVQGMVETQQWQALNDADELHYALASKDCLVGFQTLSCDFPPTFKVERQAGFHYKPSRTPSYTDRILWSTTHQLKDQIKPLTYEPIEAFTTSDHKPIRGAFEITLNREIKMKTATSAAATHSHRRKSMKNMFSSTPAADQGHNDTLHLFFNELSCSDLKSRNPARAKPDPYITFVSLPKELIQKEMTKWQKIKNKLRLSSRTKKKESKSGVVERTSRGWTRTSRKSSCTDPDWSGEEVHLIMKKPGANGKKNKEQQNGETPSPAPAESDLTGALLFITVHDHKSPLDDNVIGTFAVNLAHLYLASKEQTTLLSASLRPGEGEPGRRPSLFRRSSMFFGGHRRASFRSSGGSSAAGADHTNDLRTIDIDEPLVKDGKEQGRIRCSIDTWWFSDLASVRNVSGDSHLQQQQSSRLRGGKGLRLGWALPSMRKPDSTPGVERTASQQGRSFARRAALSDVG